MQSPGQWIPDLVTGVEKDLEVLCFLQILVLCKELERWFEEELL